MARPSRSHGASSMQDTQEIDTTPADRSRPALDLVHRWLSAPAPEHGALAGQALGRRLATAEQPRWAEHLERDARQQRLEDAATVVRRLAHDFGNVLTGILGFSELALAQQVPANTPLHGYLNEVYRAAQ